MRRPNPLHFSVVRDKARVRVRNNQRLLFWMALAQFDCRSQGHRRNLGGMLIRE